MTPSPAQITANRENATHSTGPRTPEGKARSARNATKLGLFTAHDFVLSDEREQYEAICQAFWAEFMPEGPLEETHALEIIRSSWRLQRCAKIEADLADAAIENAINGIALDPMQNEAALRTQNAVDRARAQANNTLRRATAELRRLQTNKEIAAVTLDHPENLSVLPDRKEVTAALHADEKARLTARKIQRLDTLTDILEYTDRQIAEKINAAPPNSPTAGEFSSAA